MVRGGVKMSFKGSKVPRLFVSLRGGCDQRRGKVFEDSDGTTQSAYLLRKRHDFNMFVLKEYKKACRNKKVSEYYILLNSTVNIRKGIEKKLYDLEMRFVDVQRGRRDDVTESRLKKLIKNQEYQLADVDASLTITYKLIKNELIRYDIKVDKERDRLYALLNSYLCSCKSGWDSNVCSYIDDISIFEKFINDHDSYMYVYENVIKEGE